MFSTAILAITTLVLVAAGTPGEADVRPLDLPTLIGESLAASAPHMTPGELREETVELHAELSSILARMGVGPADYERAKRLHRILHRDFLRYYRRDADDLPGVFADGRYNCLSASLLYGLLARELGYGVSVLERPGHLSLGLELDGERIAVETTSAKGYDRTGRQPTMEMDRASDLGREVSDSIASASEPSPGVATREFAVEALIGFAWLNAGWRELAADRPFNAARRVDRARRFLPYLSGTEDAQRILSRAFFDEYETGRFESAYRIAKIEFDIWPAMTTSRDRLLAVGVKRVESALDEDQPEVAVRIAREVVRIASPGRDVARFERRVWPLIAAAAVRTSDWGLASSSAKRYAQVEPDRVESVRLVEWVEERRANLSALPICELAPRIATTKASEP